MLSREQLSVPNSLGGSLRSLESLDLHQQHGASFPRSSSALGGFNIGGSSFSLNINLDVGDDDDNRTVCEGDEDDYCGVLPVLSA